MPKINFDPSNNAQHLRALLCKVSPNTLALVTDEQLVNNLRNLPEDIEFSPDTDFSFLGTPIKGMLYLLSVEGYSKSVRYLIEERGLDPNQRFIENLTAAHGAAYNGKLDVLKVLAEKNANLAAVNIYLETPLFKAMGNLESKPMLLDEIADFIIDKAPQSLEIANEDDILPIVAAYFSKSPSLVKKFINAGSDVPKKLQQMATNELWNLSSQSTLGGSNVHMFYQGRNKTADNTYECTKLIIDGYNKLHLKEDLQQMRAERDSEHVALGCEPPAGSFTNETGNTIVPKLEQQFNSMKL